MFYLCSRNCIFYPGVRMSPLRHNHIDVFHWYHPSYPFFVHLEAPAKPFHLQAAWSSKSRSKCTAHNVPIHLSRLQLDEEDTCVCHIT